MLRALVSIVVPPACAACGAPPAGQDPLCPVCRAALPWLPGPRCRRCAMAGPCGRRCPAAGQAFTRAWAPFEYDGTARRLVSVLKDRAIPPLAGLMAAQMVATAPADLLAGAAVVPVPADPGRRRRRGLDHTLLLARECSSRTGLPVSACLGRRPGPRQAGASRRSRLTAGRPAVEVVGPVPPVALLVDDVHTTGATLDSCAAALRRAGSTEVRALTYARASRRRAGNARSY